VASAAFAIPDHSDLKAARISSERSRELFPCREVTAFVELVVMDADQQSGAEGRFIAMLGSSEAWWSAFIFRWSAK
jgi:hypothetical protein